MRRLLLASLVMVSSLAAPVTGRALSCVAPIHTTPEAIVRNNLDIYDGYVPPADLFLVGTVIRVGDLLDADSGFGYRLLTVVVAGAFGDRLDGPVIEIARRTWDDDGAPGGPVRSQEYLPLTVFEMGPIDEEGRSLYIHDMCSISGQVEDPYALAAELVPMAQGAEVGYQLFPISALEEATMLPTTTTTSVPPTTTSAPQTTTTVGLTGDPGEVELPGRGWTIVVLGGIVLAGGASCLWWLRRRSDIFGRE